MGRTSDQPVTPNSRYPNASAIVVRSSAQPEYVRGFWGLDCPIPGLSTHTNRSPFFDAEFAKSRASSRLPGPPWL